ncbi:MAG TPA: addiction module protein [Candidatus Paceibacterota bacterium]|nr:addiction module protein [Candidatus Paceibacterota bacterium]
MDSLGLPARSEEYSFRLMSVADIKRVVAGLPEQERAELAAWLLDSLPAPSSADEDDLQEAVRRREDLDSGRVAPLAAAQFWSDLDRARAQWK